MDSRLDAGSCRISLCSCRFLSSNWISSQDQIVTLWLEDCSPLVFNNGVKEKIQILSLYRGSIVIAAMYMLKGSMQNKNNKLFFQYFEDFLSF